ncbi:MAG: hypothetical protein HXY22_08825 [Alphaproteobacteria bacterium]|nr:hypothetical protein [Alphaproteobacteria bacterium]
MGDTFDMKLPSRALRRIIVLGQYGSFVAGTLAWWATGGPGQSLLSWASPLLYAGCALCASTLVARYWFWSSVGECALDEREIVVRNRAYQSAYGILSIYVMSVAVYGMIALDAGLWLPRNFAQSQMVVWFTLLTAMTLPSSILAWLEPDEPGGDKIPPIGTSDMRGRFFRRILLLALLGLIAGMALALFIPS